MDSVQVVINSDKLKTTYSVKHDGEHWRLEPPPKFSVDSTKLDLWVNNIQSLHGGEIASETLSDDDKRTDLLLKPSMVLTMDYTKGDGGKAVWVLTAGQERAEDIFLYTNQRPTVYKLPASGLDMIRVPTEYFRDGKRPFHFPMEQVRVVELSSGSLNYKFKKNDLVWKVDGGDAGVELDQDKLIHMMQGLTDLEAQEYAPMAKAKGFKPNQKLVLRDEHDQVVFQMEWGDDFKATASYNKGMTFRWVKTNLEAEAMGVAAVRVTGLIDKNMVKTKTATK